MAARIRQEDVDALKEWRKVWADKETKIYDAATDVWEAKQESNAEVFQLRMEIELLQKQLHHQIAIHTRFLEEVERDRDDFDILAAENAELQTILDMIRVLLVEHEKTRSNETRRFMQDIRTLIDRGFEEDE